MYYLKVKFFLAAPCSFSIHQPRLCVIAASRNIVDVGFGYIALNFEVGHMILAILNCTVCEDRVSGAI